MLSPIPAQHDRVRYFLLTLLEKRGIDMLDHESLLTPDVLSYIPVQCLVEITGLQEGHAWKIINFAREYTERLKYKRQHAAGYDSDEEFFFSPTK